ncbi:MAG: hypothetical protein SGVNAXEH_000884, partial [Holophagaceae bacterium]
MMILAKPRKTDTEGVKRITLRLQDRFLRELPWGGLRQH